MNKRSKVRRGRSSRSRRGGMRSGSWWRGRMSRSKRKGMRKRSMRRGMRKKSMSSTW